MNLQELRKHLEKFIKSLGRKDRLMLKLELKKSSHAFPFNEYEFILAFLIDRRIISFSDYQKIRKIYISENKYLDWFGLAPRIFGEKWEEHLISLDKRFCKPTKQLDPNYEGQYDLWLEGIRVEVKAARATARRRRENVISKGLHRNSTEDFWMNFQQLKLETCDVFVFIGVWIDEIIYWVMSANEVESNKYLSHQHRGGIEYQIRITNKNIDEFETYRASADSLYETVKSKGLK